jgi:RNA polymerase sigma-70 factor, ECF subfamily
MARDDGSGRERTFRDWIETHRGILVRISRAYADGPDDEPDLLQEILLALWQSIPRFRGDAKESTWIYQVALNVALARRRARRNRPARASIEGAAEPRSDGAAAAEHRLQWAAVLDALRRLPAIDRAVLLMGLEGASQQEIARVLGVSPNAAGVRLHRARRRLSEWLGN